jgi:hypothetical protein
MAAWDDTGTVPEALLRAELDGIAGPGTIDRNDMSK